MNKRCSITRKHISLTCGNLFSKNDSTWEFIFEEKDLFETSKNKNPSKVTSYTVCVLGHMVAYLKSKKSFGFARQGGCTGAKEIRTNSSIKWSFNTGGTVLVHLHCVTQTCG